MTHGEFSTSAFSDGLVILGAAGIVIPTFARFRISPVIGFILVGLLVGPFGLGTLTGQYPWLNYVTITNEESVEPFAELGIILLLFAIGLELSFKRLWGMRRLVFGVGAGELVGCASLIGLSVHFLGESWTGSLALGLALALSSTALVLPLAGTSSPVGQKALAMLLFEDLAIVPIIFLLGAMAPYAQQEGWSGLASTLLLGSLVVAAMLVLGRFLLPGLFAQAARAKNPELFLATSLVVVIAASLATSAVGLSPIMGALVAGILIAETDYHDEVEVVTAPFRGLALGIFLITVGMSVNMRTVLDNWEALIAAVVGIVVIKAAVTGGMLWATGARRGVAAEAGLLMASPSETTLIVLAAASAAQLISADSAAFWQTVTAIGLTITPLLAKLGQIAGRRVDLQADVDVPVIGPGEAAPAVVIIRFGRVGRVVGQTRTEHKRSWLAVDSNIDTVAACRREGFPVIFGDVSRPALVDKLNLGHASALVVAMDDPALSVRLVRKVRAWCPNLTIVVRARDTRHAAELYKAGATDAVPETLESSLQLSESLLLDLGMAMGPVTASIHEKRAEMRQQIMEQGELDKAPPRRGRRLRDALKRPVPSTGEG